MSCITSSYISCGVKQLYGFYHFSPQEILLQAFATNFPPSISTLCTIIFSDEVRTLGGKALAAYIKDNKLGTIISSEIRVNPNSKNKIQTWIWHVNKRALSKWLKENKPTNAVS